MAPLGRFFQKLFRGRLDTVTRAGALLVGGHSVEDAELKYGLSVTGIAHPRRILDNAGACAGDSLVLTKALGTGILSTAIKGGVAPAGTEEKICAEMARSQPRCAEALEDLATGKRLSRSPCLHRCHWIWSPGAMPMRWPPRPQWPIRLHAHSLPALPEVISLINMGIIPEGAHANRSHYAPWFDCRLPEFDPREMLACDPQTSGGLLITLPQHRQNAWCPAWASRGGLGYGSWGRWKRATSKVILA